MTIQIHAAHAFRRALSPVRKVFRLREMKMWRRLQRMLNPITDHELREALLRATDGGRDILMVHSSLSALGQFRSGAEGVLDALRTCAATLCLPTHTYNYPATIGEPGPLFDPLRTPSKNGVLTEIYRKQDGVRRSIHATHSLAVSGPLQDEIAQHHYRADTPCGAGTPYGRLVDRHASVLMFGVTLHAYTFFHTAECEFGAPAAYEIGVTDRLRVIDESGKERDCVSRRQSWAPARFKEAGDLLERAGLVHRSALGRGSLLFVPDAFRVHEFLADRLRKSPDLLRKTSTAPLQ